MKPNSNSKKSNKTNFGKVSAKIKKVGGLKKATYEQIEHVFKVSTIKYMITLEDQLKEDKAHLLLKQNTIETLEEDLRHKNNQIRTFYINTHKNAKKVNKVFDDYKEANDSLAEKNKEIVKDNFDLTRAYNGLSQLGQFAEESGIDIKKHNGKLPENSKWDFEQKHTLTETGKVRHQYKLKPKKRDN